MPITDPATGNTHYVANAVTIRKLPEAEFTSRDHRIWSSVPLWFSFESAAGLLYRSEPIFNSTTNPTALIDTYQTGQFMNRLNLAPHVTSALHWWNFHLVPSIGIDETLLRRVPGALSGPVTRWWAPTSCAARAIFRWT